MRSVTASPPLAPPSVTTNTPTSKPSATLLEELDPQGVVETVTFQNSSTPPGNSTASAPSKPADAALLDRPGRYQARAQRAYYRALAELPTLRTNRTETEPEIPALVAIDELTKQTHSEVAAAAMKQASPRI